MSVIMDAARQAWRTFVTDGVPASGLNKPEKPEIIAAISVIDSQLSAVLEAFAAGSMKQYQSKAEMDADLVPAAGVYAILFSGDADDLKIYRKSGSTGAGSWVFKTSLSVADFSAALATLNGRMDTAEDDIDTNSTLITTGAAARKEGDAASMLAYAFATATGAADPTTGLLRLNNATAASATEAYINYTDSDAVNRKNAILAWKSAATGKVQGRLRLSHATLLNRYAEYKVTNVVDSTDYLTLTLVHVSSNGFPPSNADPIRVGFRSSADQEIADIKARLDILEA